MVQGLGFKVQGLGLRVYGSMVQVYLSGLAGLRAWSLGLAALGAEDSMFGFR